jgi:hypothetical protein
MLVVIASACATTPDYEIRILTPLRAALDTSPFTRVLVAGFLTAGSDDVDLNEETVRLLRSQLKRRGALAVIDADPLPLADAAIDRSEPQTPLRSEQDLERNQPLFANAEFWKRVGEEYQEPLIITGTVLFKPHSAAVDVARDSLLQRSAAWTSPQPRFVLLPGYLLRQQLVFIDGRTGERIHSLVLTNAVVYDRSMHTPELAAYFELMDRLLPQFLNAVVSRRVPSRRTLLK